MNPEPLASQPHQWMDSANNTQFLAYGMKLLNAAASSFLSKSFCTTPALCRSISHEGTFGVAIISNMALAVRICIDMKYIPYPAKQRIAWMDLTKREQQLLESISSINNQVA